MPVLSPPCVTLAVWAQRDVQRGWSPASASAHPAGAPVASRLALPQSGVVRPSDPHVDPSLNPGSSGRGTALNVGLSVVEATLKRLTADVCLLTLSPAAETSLSFLEGDPGGMSHSSHHKCSLRPTATVEGSMLRCDHVLYPFSLKKTVRTIGSLVSTGCLSSRGPDGTLYRLGGASAQA